jgi:hypothetical protein
MSKHAAATQSPQTLLTTRALNAFLTTVHAEVDKSGFSKFSEQDILASVADMTLPVGQPDQGHEELRWVLHAKPLTLGDKKHTLPETMRDLKARIRQDAVPQFVHELDPDAAEKRYREILNIAYRAAEKEMSRGAAASP